MSGGRPSKLTPEAQARIIEALRAGNYQESAAAYAGVGVATFYRWMERGKRDDAEPEYREFREAVERARAEAEVRNVGLIQRSASEGTWQAAAWFLERSFPNRWGRRERHEVVGSGGGPVEVSVDAEALESRLAAIIASRRDSTDGNTANPVVG